jgi:hypothetical protein
MATVGFKNLCAPSLFYLVFSVLILFVIGFQNYGNQELYCLGYYSCPVTSTYLIFIMKFVYILFWTWILNLICKDGSPAISWMLVLIPIMLFFILLGSLLLRSRIYI